MLKFLDLKRKVGAGEAEDESDVIATKKALRQSGDYAPPGGHLTGWRDQETTNALKTVQRRNGIWPDGTMRPGGPTHRIINAEIQEREAKHRPKGLGLTATVGDRSANRPADIQRVQDALGYRKKRYSLHCAKRI